MNYAVTLTKSPGLTDAERRARLGRVYSFLLSLASRTADDDNLDRGASSAAGGIGTEARRQAHDTVDLTSAQAGGAS